MYIRRAKDSDTEGLLRLLSQVLEIHHRGRPDIFKTGAVKYGEKELYSIICDDSRPIFCAVDENERVLGYAFCIFQRAINDNILTDIKTLYIDDLCVDSTLRGMGIGKRLYRHVLDFAAESGCYNVTLNVWALNESALAFYRSLGMDVMKIGMEQKIEKRED